MSLIVIILSVVVALDHALAASSQIKASSTYQLITQLLDGLYESIKKQ